MGGAQDKLKEKSVKKFRDIFCGCSENSVAFLFIDEI